MRRTLSKEEGMGVFDLIEEATHLLRTAPAGTLAAYYVGAIPFALGGLYFWADMSRSPFADQRLAGGALGMAVLYAWMKFWQTVFSRRIRSQIVREPPPRWTPAQCWRVFKAQFILQPSGLFLLPLSLLPMLPVAWVYAYYQNVTVLDDATLEAPELARRARQQAMLWPRQNHTLLLIVGLCGFFVFVNWIIVALAAPSLIKMLFGVESVFTRSPLAMLNSTFFMAMLVTTFLCVDPLVKVLYTLRCFYGEALQSGADLRAELAASSVRPVHSMLPVVLLLVLLQTPPVFAAEGEVATAAPVNVSPPISAVELDRAIAETIQESKYAWRLPRERSGNSSDQGIIAKFLDKVVRTVRGWFRDALEWIGNILKKLFSRDRTDPARDGFEWVTGLHLLLYVLIAVLVAALVLFLLRWRARRRLVAPIATEAIQVMPDIGDESTAADQLPEDSWIALGRELLGRGELRLALRAFYLASLAHLASRNFISLARFKSNRDYGRELRRRAHSLPELAATFDENVSVFERIWYGMHEVNAETVERFASNLERFKRTA